MSKKRVKLDAATLRWVTNWPLANVLKRASHGANWPVDTNVGAERWRLVLHEVTRLRERILVRARHEERLAAQEARRG